MCRISSFGFRASVFALAICSLLVSGCRRVEKGSTPVEVMQTPSGVEMVRIPAGWFEMGSTKGMEDERPVHRVWVDSFWMDRYEVVQSQFREFQIPDPSQFKDPNFPVVRANWTDAAIHYCNERSLAEGLEPCYDETTLECNFQANGYRLPTEAEWEYACRAGTSTEYSFGNNAARLGEYAWFVRNSGGTVHPVGLKEPNPWGLFDMHGNVAEWCHDRYGADYYSSMGVPPMNTGKARPEPAEGMPVLREVRNPRGPAAGSERVVRGGGWNSSAESCRSAYRVSDPAIDDTCLANDAVGFRCVRNAPSQAAETEAVAAAKPTPKTRTAFVYDDVYLEHETTPGHPESPQRLVAIVEHLKKSGLYSEVVHLRPVTASRRWIETVHTAEYIDRARRSCAEGRAYLDCLDMPICERSYDVAVMAVGGVLAAVDAVMEGKVTNAFCAVRPPGHHAVSDQALGFCMFNNVAIGTCYVQQKYHLPRVLIVDWDIHHGNGTQAAFYDDPNVLYFSTHQWPFYPGTGSALETGRGAGTDSTMNFPLPRGTGDSEIIKIFEGKLRRAALAFAPDFVFISAGFDAHEGDLLGSMNVTTEGFARLTRIVKEIATQCCQGRLVATLEGGYRLEDLAASVEAHLRVLME
ncbi:MAG: SUMF1/EgtB/PvdO family nonheme iron enzyme [Sedimentisphaerales bacterium]|nr:SUMF1/EgtB/PvdO family nonheme iron enzyme [Sedimentisphaerales bacterium]